jgi:FkbM family methyltransferase
MVGMRAAEQNLIYDVGAHKGEDTEFYLKKGFSVVAIEANPVLYLALAKKFEEFVKGGRLVLLNVAISDHPGEVALFVSDKSDWGTTDQEWANRNERLGFPSQPVIVKSDRLETILQRHGIPYFLKIDIEGADLLCLHALKGFDVRPKFLSIESNKVSWKKLKAELSLLESLGYTRFKAINQGRVPHQQQPNPPKEGVFVSHCFENGSSGLFGEESPGLWMYRAIVTTKYYLIFVRYKLFGDNTFGSRILLKLSKRFPQCLRLQPSWYDTHAKLGFS